MGEEVRRPIREGAGIKPTTAKARLAGLKRRPGRPAKSPEGPKRANLKLRMHERTRAQLETRAAAHGRSLSEEAESLIETAMQSENIVEMVLGLLRRRGIT